MIPKRIIQTGPPQSPLLLQAGVKSVQLLHPDYEYHFFDDAMIDQFLRDEFPDYVTEYHSFRFRIQKYDFFRYLAIYHYGGFYFDLDVFFAREVTPLLSTECVFSFEELAEAQYFPDTFGLDWQIGNYAFGAEPSHPFLAAIIDNCIRAKHDPVWVKPMMRGIPRWLYNPYYILNTTGPGLVSRTYAENPQLARHVSILFPDDVCDQSTWHQFGSFAVHHMSGTWREKSGFLTRRLTRVWDQWNLRRMLAEGRKRGKTRALPGSGNKELTALEIVL